MSQKLVLPKCPNCKKLYKFYAGDEEYEFLMKHDSSMCPYGLEAYYNSREECVKAVREYFKENFPWKYPDARARLS